MVCLLCSAKTKITNSRYRSSQCHTWRRHTCTRCNAIFTTRESVSMSQSYRVEDSDGILHNFSTLRLLLSIHIVMTQTGHNDNEIEMIGETILAKLQKQRSLIIPVSNLIKTVYDTLKSYDHDTALIYAARHRSSLGRARKHKDNP
jgi:transcriptional regulator NrdR family protein